MKSRQLFLAFIDANATMLLDERTLVVRFPKRAHNPLLVAAGFDTTDVPVLPVLEAMQAERA